MLYSYSEIERLLRDGNIYVEFKYAWHFFLSSFRRYDVTLLSSRSLFCEDDELVKKVDDCLKHGANTNNREGPGVTGLMLTCMQFSFCGEAGQQVERVVSFLSLLLKHGAEVNQQDFYGSTALHYAFQSRNYYLPPEEGRLAKKLVVQILIKHKAKVYLKNSFGISAIDMAKREGHESWLKTDEA
jgi:ankyrin repeat protein